MHNKSLQLTNNTPLRSVLWSTEFKRYPPNEEKIVNAYKIGRDIESLATRIAQIEDKLEKPHLTREDEKLFIKRKMHEANIKAFALKESISSENNQPAQEFLWDTFSKDYFYKWESCGGSNGGRHSFHELKDENSDHPSMFSDVGLDMGASGGNTAHCFNEYYYMVGVRNHGQGSLTITTSAWMRYFRLYIRLIDRTGPSTLDMSEDLQFIVDVYRGKDDGGWDMIHHHEEYLLQNRGDGHPTYEARDYGNGQGGSDEREWERENISEEYMVTIPGTIGGNVPIKAAIGIGANVSAARSRFVVGTQAYADFRLDSIVFQFS